MQYARRFVFLSLCFAGSAAQAHTHQHVATHVKAASTSFSDVAIELKLAQSHFVSQIAQSGLITAVDLHDDENGIGGDLEGEIKILASGSSQDNIQEELTRVSQFAVPSFDNSSVLSQSGSDYNISDIFAAQPLAAARLTSNYGYRKMGGRGEFHPGIDLAAPTGTPIYATGDGVVIYAGWRGGYGNFVEIQHANGFKTRYAHASALFVSVGQSVSRSQRIANVGSTGRSTGPHLHYEVFKDGQRQNPATYLAYAPKANY